MTFVTFVLVGTAHSASDAVEKTAEKMRTEDVKTVITEVENTDHNPCLPEGKSHQIDLQVKKASAYDLEKNEVVYVWESVKTINVSADGTIMEVCSE